MLKLKALQNDFIEAIYREEKLELLKKIKDGKAPKAELIDIYRNNLYATLTNSLKLTYPKIHQILGAKKFKKLCYEFIKNNRSQSGNLDDYGENFAEYLDGAQANVARLEWLKQKSYLAKDAQQINLEELKKLSPEKLFEVRFKLHPSCFLLESKPKYFLIHRSDRDVLVSKISKAEYRFLTAIAAGLSLFQIYENHKINIKQPLQKHLANGVICEFFSK